MGGKRMHATGKNRIDSEGIRGFIETYYRKNRTLVSKDIAGIFDGIEKLADLPLIRHAYKTGEDHGTWIVPPRWDIREAWLKDRHGRIIASYEDHPLFVSPYSRPVHLTLNAEELIAHTISEPSQPNAYAFNWRYAADYRLRLKDWGISLPQNIADNLSEGPFELLIDAEIEDGEMLVGEIVIPGESTETLLFIANYCHPGQVNDSFSGLVMFTQVMKMLARKTKLHYTYKLLIVHETIGSAVYISSDTNRLKPLIGAVFSEMVGWGKEWFIKLSRRGNTYIDMLAAECCRAFPQIRSSDFFSLIGNDEYIFDSVQAGVPTLSLQKYPFEEYHTSNDEPSRIVDADLQQAADIILHMVEVLEKDAVYESTVPVPFWMTRYDLYADDQYTPEEFTRNLKIVYNYLDGKKSVLQIADLVNSPFSVVNSYIMKMKENGLVRFIDKSARQVKH
jgi:aminopeptidase-like protein